ncbi:methyltransferase [Bacillus pakistanensis]|uniref:Methyltransferase n=1 Tax=Rossellomorea pakistanensis TaxID=992288 RepID=A0ABS2N8U2_9BACI|nr:isoprenylcysteine carboxylmethyltransferase family protein [Bacillus pakistanensis]MBM7584285.1 methyltransferase [Bacillus pakistanensis]
MFFYIFLIVVASQRLIEVLIAKRNEKWMKSKGAKEYGKRHYRLMVAIHFLFFVSLIMESILGRSDLNSDWPLLVAVFFIVQLCRVWVIMALGRFWNTKIIVLKDAEVVAKGPYKFIKHPNYLIVTIELIIIPLIFNAYWTLFIFAILNQLILAIRIPLEEEVLNKQTNYEDELTSKRRFIPLIRKSR